MQSNEQIRLRLIAEADAINAKYPQYKNHFDNYKLAVALKDIKNKYREVMFKKGQHMIVDGNSIHKPEYGPYVNTEFIYVVIKGLDTSTRLKDIKIQG